jgi:hypothetical protein
MELSFESGLTFSVIDYCLKQRGITGYRDNFSEMDAIARDIPFRFRFFFEDDACILALYQWSAAAFACGLIESPRIERM